MANLKSFFTNKFRNKYPPPIFKKLYLRNLLSEILAKNNEYCRKNNIKVIKPREISVNNKYITEKRFLFISLLCTFYASHKLHVNTSVMTPLFNVSVML